MKSEGVKGGKRRLMYEEGEERLVKWHEVAVFIFIFMYGCFSASSFWQL